MVATRKRSDSEEVRPVTPEWQAKVRAELDARPRGAHSQPAKAVDASTGQISELLAERDHKEARYSRLVAKVDRFFGWSRDIDEIRHLLEGLDDDSKNVLRALKRLEPDQRRAAAAFLLQMAKAVGNDKG